MIEIFLLSLIQGITEFIPVSSSSHLILFSNYTNFEEQSLLVDVSLHIGSFLAVLCYFYKDILDFVKNKILFLKILISSIPVMLIGFFLVETNLIISSEEKIMIHYLFSKVDNDWKIFDVLLEGTISEIATKKSEFSKIIEEKGVDTLANSIRKKFIIKN